jgi:hypothetical protein
MSTLKSYTRIVATEDGSSAFEDGELTLSERPMGDGAPPMFVGALGADEGAAFVQLAAFHGEPHPASPPQWVVVLRGFIEAEVGDGTSRRFGPGDFLLATDVSGRGHITRVVGDTPFEGLGIPTTPSG